MAELGVVKFRRIRDGEIIEVRMGCEMGTEDQPDPQVLHELQMIKQHLGYTNSQLQDIRNYTGKSQICADETHKMMCALFAVMTVLGVLIFLGVLSLDRAVQDVNTSIRAQAQSSVVQS